MYSIIIYLSLAFVSYSAAAEEYPSCLNSNVTLSEFQIALENNYGTYPEPQFQDWGSWVEVSARSIGCSFLDEQLFESSFEDALPLESKAAPTTYTSAFSTPKHAVNYCGPHNSSRPGSEWISRYTGNVSIALNELCRQHDNCYGNACVSRACNFSTGDYEGTACDEPIVGYCTSSSILSSPINDIFVCAIILTLLNPSISVQGVPVNQVRAVACAPQNCDRQSNEICLFGGDGTCQAANVNRNGFFCGKVRKHVFPSGFVSYTNFNGFVNFATTDPVEQRRLWEELPVTPMFPSPSYYGIVTRWGKIEDPTTSPLQSCYAMPNTFDP